MIRKDNQKNYDENSVSNIGNFMDTLRKNIVHFKKEKKWTLRTLADKADMSEDTLGTLLNGKNKDCNMSTVIKIAKALNVCIDELIEADTVSQRFKESISICRKLPDNDVYLIQWYIRYIESLHKGDKPNKRYVSVMELDCNHHGNLKITSNYTRIDISHINEEYRYKVFFGVKIPCEHYMPIYSPYDILLVANDRLPSYNEHCLVRTNNNFYIARRKVENGTIKYISILDNRFKYTDGELCELVGYIIGFLNPDGSWGIR